MKLSEARSTNMVRDLNPVINRKYLDTSTGWRFDHRDKAGDARGHNGAKGEEHRQGRQRAADDSVKWGKEHDRKQGLEAVTRNTNLHLVGQEKLNREPLNQFIFRGDIGLCSAPAQQHRGR